MKNNQSIPKIQRIQHIWRAGPGYAVLGQKALRSNLAMASINQVIVQWPSRPTPFHLKKEGGQQPFNSLPGGIAVSRFALRGIG
jgi:hypothetical protein